MVLLVAWRSSGLAYVMLTQLQFQHADFEDQA